MSKSKIALRVEKIVSFIASVIKNRLTDKVVCLMSDNTIQERVYVFDVKDTTTMKSARTFKEFTSVSNKCLDIQNLALDRASFKQALCKNTAYDKSHTVNARALSLSNFVASNDRIKAVKKVVVKVATSKKATSKKVAKK